VAVLAVVEVLAAVQVDFHTCLPSIRIVVAYSFAAS
jgi:hypothetical protein